MIIGVDEVGRGCIAGDLVVCAFRLKDGLEPVRERKFRELAMDSKAFRSRASREDAALIMRDVGEFELARATPAMIDEKNIRGATLWAMATAAQKLICRTEDGEIYFDGRDCPEMFRDRGKAIIKGDALVAEISAASIIAKTARDAEMVEASASYPGYGFERHAGYGTVEHRDAIKRLGLCDIHRSWARKFMAP